MLRFYNKKDDGILHSVFALSLIIFMVCAVYLVQYAVDSIKSQLLNDEVIEKFKVADAGEGELVDKYAGERDIYPDVVGRLIFDNGDEKMEYLVMQTDLPDEKHYLDYNAKNQKRKEGNPFLDYRCSVKEQLTDNFMIYAQNMKDNTQFGSLDNNYKKKSYWEKHKTLQFETMYEDMQEYEIFAAFYSKVYNVGDDVFKYYYFFDAANEQEFNDYIDGVTRLSLYKTGIVPKYGEQLITLSTCSYHVKNGRFVVVARKKTGRLPVDNPVTESDDDEMEPNDGEDNEEEEEEPDPTPTPTRRPTATPSPTPAPTPTPTPTPTPEPTYQYMTMTPTQPPEEDPGGQNPEPPYGLYPDPGTGW